MKMFFPKDMSRITLVSHRAHMKRIIDALYEAKVLHIKEYIPKEGDYYPIGSPLGNAEKISELLLLIQSLKTQLGIKGEGGKWEHTSIGKAERFLRKFREDADRIDSEIKEVEEKLKSLKKRYEIVSFLREVGVRKFSVLSGYGTLDVTGGYVSDLEALKNGMSGIDCEIFGSDRKREKGYPVVLFTRKEDAEKVREVLGSVSFSRIETRMEWRRKAVEEEESVLKNEIHGLERRKSELERKLRRIGKERGAVLLGIEKSLRKEITKSEVPLKFAVSGHTFMVQGWVPKGKEDFLKKRIAGITDNIYFSVEDVRHGEAPTQIDNRGPLRPFEFFLRLYSLPKYKEVDPTFLLFITYPLIFGIMLGDIGYGLVLFLTFAFVKFRLKKLRSVSSVLMASSLATIIFGFVFGEFFGTEHILWYELHPLIHRGGQHMNQLLIIAISIGLVHVNLGILFGFINSLKERHYRHAFGKFSWFLLQTGGILYGLTLFNIRLLDPGVSLVILLTGVIGLALGEGFIGIVEIPTLISNILSYARIAAVGLASVSLAVIVNEMAEGMFHAGGIFLIMGVMLLIAGHAINTMIGLLDSFLQSLRLHYVEMFSKFYHGNGEPYKPFGS